MESENSEFESGNWLSSSWEASKEKSERQKESSKRAQSQLQKIQKDEKKAKWDNEDLFLILSRFIQNPLYETQILWVTSLLEKTYSSRFIMSVVALVFPEAAQFVLRATGNQSLISQITHLHHYELRQKFDDETIHASIRDWMSTWIRVSQEFLTQEESSLILMEKLSNLLASSDRKYALLVLSDFFSFFFDMRNLSIDTKKSLAYADFILSELQISLLKYLDTSDTDLRKWEEIDTNRLFGI